MRVLLKRIGTALLFLAIALCLAPTLVPPFLDRIYYEGPPSDHFDGSRFFNPGHSGASHGSPAGFVNRVLRGNRAEWPQQVPVTPGYPPAQATPCPRLNRAVAENWRRCVDAVEPGLMAATLIGHATVLVQAGGINILTDPIWSERASPFSFVGPKRVRAPGIRFDDLPKIDLVLVSHNHYDHLDLPTLKALWERDRPLIVTSLGNDTILKKAGIEAVARDWGERVPVRPGIEVAIDRNHHWGSRWGTDRNRALWSAFTVILPGGNLFFAGDTGWGDGSWVREAARHGRPRLAILPIGAYEPRDFMKTNHVNPEESVHIFEMLDPQMALGMHWGTFQLTFEPIDEPRQKLADLVRSKHIRPGRFVAPEVGKPFEIPPLDRQSAGPTLNTQNLLPSRSRK